MSEISEDMIHKAAVVISELRESENGLVLSSHIAEVALKAAGVAALIHENHEARRLLVTRVEAKDLDAAMDRIAELEAANAKLRTRLGKELGWVNN